MIVVIWCCHVRRCMRGSRVATSCCKTHCYECMNVAWALFWGGSRSTKPSIFPCKVAAAGDERYLVCAAVAVWIVSRSIGSSSVFCNEWLFLCAKFYAFLDSVVADRLDGCMIVVIWCCHVRRCMRGSRVATSCCKTHCYGCMNVAWALFWGGSRSTQPCIFPCKVAAAGDERYLVCAAVAVWIVWRSIGSSSVFCNEWLFLCV